MGWRRYGERELLYEMELLLKFGKLKRLMRLKVRHDGFKLVNFLEWPSVVASVR